MPDDSAQPPTPRSLKSDGESLVIEWADGVTHRLRWSLLREKCPCATCRKKQHQPPEPASLLPVLSPSEAQPLGIVSMQPMGNYAYAMEFNDGHSSGIYSLDYLRSLGEQLATQQAT